MSQFNLCQVLYLESLCFFICSTLVMAMVIVRNKFTFNRLLWFIFACFFIAFSLMLLASIVLKQDKINKCFETLIPAAIIETEEGVIIMLYMLVVLRMLYIYSKIRKPG